MFIHSPGLFRAAILQSGSPVAYWALIPKSKAGDRSKGPLHHLDNLGCYIRNDRDKVMKCLRNIDTVTLTNRDYRVSFVAPLTSTILWTIRKVNSHLLFRETFFTLKGLWGSFPLVGMAIV